MSWIAAGVTAATAIYGANKASKASKNAANAQSQSADQASKVQWDMFNQSRQDQEPFRQAGLTGLNEYMALLGLPTGSVQQASSAASVPTEWFGAGNSPTVNAQLYASDHRYKSAWDQVSDGHFKHFGKGFNQYSDRDAIQNDLATRYGQMAPPQAAAGQPGTSLTQADAFARFRNQPGYQFGLDEGSKTLQSSAAASGGLFSGKAGKALTKFGQDYADQQGFSPYMNRLASLSGIGQTATNNIGALGQNTANQVGNNLMNAGAARASGIQNSANVWGQAAGQLGGLAGYMYGNKGGSGWGWGGV